MSAPISYCEISAAVRSEEVFEDLFRKVKINQKYGHYSQIGCDHNPKCSIVTEEELKKLNDRLALKLEDLNNQSKFIGEPGEKGEKGEIGILEKN